MKWAFREQKDVWEPEESLRLGINSGEGKQRVGHRPCQGEDG